MFTQLLRFEWRYHIQHISFPAFALFFGLFGFLLSGRAFGDPNLYNNAPYNLTKVVGLMSLAAIFCMMVLASRVLLRDQQSRMQELIFATPVHKGPFLLSRFMGYFTVSLLLFAFTMLGLWIGAMVTPPGKYLGPIDGSHYVWLYLIMAVPNLLIGGVVLFSIASLTRSTLATYVGGILLYCLYWLAAMLLNSPMMAGATPASAEGLALAALLDPFGLSAFFEQTRYWEVVQKNTEVIALTGNFLYNRILWIVISLSIFLANYFAFKFRKGKHLGRTAARSVVTEALTSPIDGLAPPGLVLPARRSFADQLHMLWSNFKIELSQILRSWPFWVIMVAWAGIVASEILTRIYGGGEYGTSLYPTTNLMIWLFAEPFKFLSLLLVIFYAGEMVHRERVLKMNEFKDSLPIPNWVFALSKYLALVSIPILLISSAIFIAIICQSSKGWFEWNLPLYLSAFYINGLLIFFFAVMAVFIQNLVPNKYLGMLLSLVFVLVFTSTLGAQLGISHPLLRIGALPSLEYNNMNGYGPQLNAFNWMALLWGSFYLSLGYLTTLVWRRGTAVNIFRRIEFTPKRRGILVVSLSVFLLVGGFVYYNTNILNAYQTRAQRLDQLADYEKKYKVFEDLLELSIIDVKTKVDLHPKERQYFIEHEFILQNKNEESIREVYFTASPFTKVCQFELSRAVLRKHDDTHGVYWFEFAEPVQPGDTVRMRYDIEDNHQGLQVGTSFFDMDIVENGTNIMNRFIAPSFGYRHSNEITDNEERKKRGLAPIEEEPEDPLHSETNVDQKFSFETVISTDADQIAIAPGQLIEEKADSNRRIFHYKTEQPINNFYSYLSAKYAVKKLVHRGVSLEVYYAPGHDFNVAHMLQIMRQTLDYCQNNFSSYGMDHLRIAEIPGHWPMGGYATPGVIGLVEDRSFFTDLRDSTSFDVVAKRVAHEVAHQWFGHQLNPEFGPGASMIVESFAKYLEVIAMDQLHGKGQLRQLLKDQMNDYFYGRSLLDEPEPALDRVENQAFIFYAKGCIVMNALRDLVGEKPLNAAISEMINCYGYPNPRGTAQDFITILKSRTPPHTHARIDDWVSKVLFFDNKITNVKTESLADGQYKITLQIEASKKVLNDAGAIQDTSFAEAMTIGFFDQHPDQLRRSDSPVYLERHSIQDGANELVIILNQLPKYVVLDPYLNLLDKNVYDNVRVMK